MQKKQIIMKSVAQIMSLLPDIFRSFYFLS